MTATSPLTRHADEGQHPFAQPSMEREWTLKQVQGDEDIMASPALGTNGL